jgi:geranylgeranyl diphosphate synthase type II
MDNASSRRGRSTVHKRWDSGTAILVGDALLGLAYKALMKTKSERLRQVVDIFTDGVVEVCEGQGYDKEFEAVPALPLKRYLTMIEKKTARLVALSAEIGALIGGGSKEEVDSLRRYGWHVGRAFQIQDDLLDIVGDEKKFGKRIGGDVLEGKKTYLLVKALELVDGDDRELIDIIARRQGVKSGRIPAVKEIYQRHGIVESANLQIQNNIRRAVSSLQSIKDRKTRARLIWFSDMLLKRGS